MTVQGPPGCAVSEVLDHEGRFWRELDGYLRRQQKEFLTQTHCRAGAEHAPLTTRQIIADTKYSVVILQMLHEVGKIFALQGALCDRVPNLLGLFLDISLLAGRKLKTKS
jgi:hypothetical protein